MKKSVLEAGPKLRVKLPQGQGFLKKISDCCLLIPVVNKKNITPHTEYMQVLIWHMLVSHPLLKYNLTKWEEVSNLKGKI